MTELNRSGGYGKEGFGPISGMKKQTLRGSLFGAAKRDGNVRPGTGTWSNNVLLLDDSFCDEDFFLDFFG